MALCAMHAKTFAQEMDSILYILPDKIEVKLDSLIAERKKYNEISSFRLNRLNENEFQIIPRSKRKDGNSDFSTNRFVLIKNTKYPVTFDYDEIFSTVDPCNTGEFGNREGYIRKVLTIFEGYSLIFDRAGNVIKENWGIYEGN